MSDYRKFSVVCACGGLTSKVYARTHGGKCKKCFTGTAPKVPAAPAKTNYRNLCPTCGERTLTAYQKRNGYHCDGCTRDADPIGYVNEVSGYGDYC